VKQCRREKQDNELRNYNGEDLNADGLNALSLNRVCDIINNVLNRDEGAVASILA
jgi:hypothetical protein